ncbi:helix-turn-helix transcriptional regulator [Lactiplantibacillus paraxiangfangensis]|uniref:helix-turn-helix transcriptional regulator n=1 Tax=Lactiplantibacillus paraxiangfangensis TaxID=3076224 RepID=UPI0030C73FAF
MENQLRKLREEKGLTQLELANLLKSNQRTVSKWERGKSTPKPSQMQFLEDYFHTPKEEIFFEAFNYKMLLNGRM